MAETSFPFSNQTNGEDQWRLMASQWQQSGVIPQSSASGAVGDQLLVSADGTGMFVRVGAGRAVILGHYYENTTPITLSIDQITTSGQRRLDLIALELSLVESEAGAPRMQLVVVKGTPYTGTTNTTHYPQPQRNLNVYQLSLGYVDVPNYVGTTATPVIPAANAISARNFASMPTLLRGTMPLVPTGAWPGLEQPPMTGQLQYNAATQKLEVWNGSAFQDPTPTLRDQHRTNQTHTPLFQSETFSGASGGLSAERTMQHFNAGTDYQSRYVTGWVKMDAILTTSTWHRVSIFPYLESGSGAFRTKQFDQLGGAGFGISPNSGGASATLYAPFYFPSTGSAESTLGFRLITASNANHTIQLTNTAFFIEARRRA